MTSKDRNHTGLPAIGDKNNFDAKSGTLLERVVFNNRPLILLICFVISIFLGYEALQLKTNAAFDRMIPRNHPYIQNYFENKLSLSGLGNSLSIVVENTQGDIYDPEYVDALRQINDTVMLLPGIDRSWMKSLWMPIVRYTEVTEEGYKGGPVMPDGFDGTPHQTNVLRDNVRKAGLVGTLVATNQRSSMIVAPMLDTIGDTGLPVDYVELSRSLESKVLSKQTGKIKVHIVGFPKLVGDLIDGLGAVIGYFGISALIATVFIYLYTRCLRSTGLLVSISLLSVVWLLGIMRLAGFELDPYSILAPFLIFCIGLSHGAQRMNGIMQDVGRGTHKYVAARYTFRRLFMAGLTALLTNVVGFGVLMVIDIPVIQALAIQTSIGVTILIFTKLILIPVGLSYTGVSADAAKRSLKRESGEHNVLTWGGAWQLLGHLTEKRWAIPIVAFSLVAAAMGYMVSLNLKIGDLDRGAPELKADSKYNKDVEYVSKNYNTTSDQFAVIVKMKSGGCIEYGNVIEQDRLTQYLLQVPGVVGVAAAPTPLRIYISGMFEGYPKWMSLSRNVSLISGAMQAELVSRPELTNADCGIQPSIAYLTDHKAETLTRLVTAVERYAAEHNTSERSFSLAAGSAGIEAVTNIVVADANRTMLLLLYASVTILCFITFRSWRAVVVALVPLIITSILCEALMVWLEIGVKVATLPAIALGVGIGVDYALYLLSVQLAEQRAGATLKEAYLSSIMFTGKMVALIGMTLAAGVFTWVFSPIKFQADMGILLTFMFVWNMLGALVLIPALSYFLLNKVGVTQRASVQDDLAIIPSEEDSEVTEKSSLQTEWDAQSPSTSDFGPSWFKRGFTKMNI